MSALTDHLGHNIKMRHSSLTSIELNWYSLFTWARESSTSKVAYSQQGAGTLIPTA
ncbi:hypothetical protein GIB67_035330, partial [Kingdonia uniflora]